MTGTWQRALDGHRLLVSGFGRWGGGVYDLTDGWPRAVDNLSTSGMTVGGGHLWRVLRAPGEQTSTCELLSYDERGVCSYRRLDAVRDPHDLCWHDGALHLSSSWNDTVWRLADGDHGDPVAVWRAGTMPDSWHLNSLTVAGGHLHASAFGRFDRHRAWKRSGTTRAGAVIDLATGRDVLSGLAQPHSPRHTHGRWYVCESARGTLTELDADGTVVRRSLVKRFSRGLAVVGRWALVGGNADRSRGERDRGELVVVDLDTFDVVDRIPLPCLEVYEVIAVPPDLARGLAVGFGTNAVRAVEQHRALRRPPDQHPTPPDVVMNLTAPRVAGELARMGQVLPIEDVTRCVVRGPLPDRARAGATLSVTLDAVNGSSDLLGSVPPRPVRVAARWFPPGGREPLRNPGTPLPRVLHPGERTTVDVVLEVPDVPGRYELRVALRQRGLGWFGVRAESVVDVVP